MIQTDITVRRSCLRKNVIRLGIEFMLIKNRYSSVLIGNICAFIHIGLCSFVKSLKGKSTTRKRIFRTHFIQAHDNPAGTGIDDFILANVSACGNTACRTLLGTLFITYGITVVFLGRTAFGNRSNNRRVSVR